MPEEKELRESVHKAAETLRLRDLEIRMLKNELEASTAENKLLHALCKETGRQLGRIVDQLRPLVE